MEPLVTTWERICKEKGYQFATIETTNAIYDRVALIEKTQNLLVVEYPKNTKKGIIIKRETILKRYITKMKYYKD